MQCSFSIFFLHRIENDKMDLNIEIKLYKTLSLKKSSRWEIYVARE